MSGLSVLQIRRRFLLLYFLRWMPVGLTIPILVLLPLDRGLGMSEIGTALAIRGIVWLLIDLPAGGLADRWGRRPTLVTSSVINVVSLIVLAMVESFAGLAIYSLLQGVYRALDSGPLQAWYVDATEAADRDASIERGFVSSGVILGVTLAAGSLLSGALVFLDPIPGVSPFVAPVLVAVVISVAAVVGLLLLITEHHPAAERTSFVGTLREVPVAVREALTLTVRSRALALLAGVELTWGFGMVTWEALFPLKLTEVSSTELAAVWLSPASAAAWFASALGAACVPLLTTRIGPVRSAVTLRVAQGVTVLGIGLFTGPVGVVAAYLACYVVHGISNPVHQGLLHRSIESRNRATATSVNSTAAQLANSGGLIVLTWLADSSGAPPAIVTGAVIIALGAPLYLWFGSARSRRTAEPAGPAPEPGTPVAPPSSAADN